MHQVCACSVLSNLVECRKLSYRSRVRLLIFVLAASSVLACATTATPPSESDSGNSDDSVDYVPPVAPPVTSPKLSQQQIGDVLWTMRPSGDAFQGNRGLNIAHCDRIAKVELLGGLEYHFDEACSVSRLDIATGTASTKVVARTDGLPNLSMYPAPSGAVGFVSSVTSEYYYVSVNGEVPYIYPRSGYVRSEMREAGGAKLWELNCYSELPSNVAGAAPDTYIRLGPTDVGTTYAFISYKYHLTCRDMATASCSGTSSCSLIWLLDETGAVIREVSGVSGSIVALPRGGLLSYSSNFPVGPVTATTADGSIAWTVEDLTYPVSDVTAQGDLVTIVSFDNDFPGQGSVIVVNDATGQVVVRIDGTSARYGAVGSDFVWTSRDDVLWGYSLTDGSLISSFSVASSFMAVNAVDPLGNPVVTLDDTVVALRGFEPGL